MFKVIWGYIHQVWRNRTVNSLCQVFTTHRIPKMIISRSVTLFALTWFEDFCRSLNISLLRSSLYLSGQDEQLTVWKGNFLCHMEKRVEDILNSSQLRYRMTPHIGVIIWLRYRRNFLSRYAAFTFKSKTDPTESYLDRGYFLPPWNSEIPQSSAGQYGLTIFAGRCWITMNIFIQEKFI